MTPGWILDILAALMLGVAAVSAARLVAAGPRRRDLPVASVDVAHLLMAIAMAGMLTSSLSTLPDGGWEVVFALLTAWFAYRVVRDSMTSGIRALAGGHCAPHLVHSAAMLYMFLALAAPATGSMGGSAMQTLTYPTVAFVFAMVLAGYSVWDLDQLSGRRYSLTTARVSLAAPALVAVGPSTAVLSAAQVRQEQPATPAVRAILLSPGVTVGCRIVMGVTMAFMLLIMI